MASLPQIIEGASAPSPSCNVVPFRSAAQLAVESVVGCSVPVPEHMSPAEYEEAWKKLMAHAEAAKAYDDYCRKAHLLTMATGESVLPDGEEGRAFQRMRALTVLVASLPTPLAKSRYWSKHYMMQKRRLIGHVWLHATGPLYDGYRASVKADEARYFLHFGRRAR